MYKQLEIEKIIVKKKFMVYSMENAGSWRSGNKLVRVNDTL